MESEEKYETTQVLMKEIRQELEWIKMLREVGTWMLHGDVLYLDFGEEAGLVPA